MLPFMFIFNTDILLIDVTFLDGVIVFIASVAGMLAFCSAVQNYMFVRNRIWESLLLLVIAFSMFRLNFWQDRVSPPCIEIPSHEVLSRLGDDGPNGLAGNQRLRVQLRGLDFDDADRILQRNAILELDGALTADMRLEQAGLMLDISDGIAIVGEPSLGMLLFQELGNFDFYADRVVTVDYLFVETPDRAARAFFYLPFLAVLLVIDIIQHRRKRQSAG